MAAGIDFEAQGKVFTLRYGFNALCSLEQQTGRKALEIFRSLNGDDLDLRMFRTVVKIGLGGKLADEKVGDIIDDVGIKRIADLLGQAVRLAFPEGEPGEAQAEA